MRPAWVGERPDESVSVAVVDDVDTGARSPFEGGEGEASRFADVHWCPAMVVGLEYRAEPDELIRRTCAYRRPPARPASCAGATSAACRLARAAACPEGRARARPCRTRGVSGRARRPYSPSDDVTYAVFPFRVTASSCAPGTVQPPEHLASPRIERDDLVRGVAGDVEDPSVRREDPGVRTAVRGRGIGVPGAEQRVGARVDDRDRVRSIQAERDELAVAARVHVVWSCRSLGRFGSDRDSQDLGRAGDRPPRSRAMHRTPPRRRACLSRTRGRRAASSLPSASLPRPHRCSPRNPGSCARRGSRPRSSLRHSSAGPAAQRRRSDALRPTARRRRRPTRHAVRARLYLRMVDTSCGSACGGRLEAITAAWLGT